MTADEQNTASEYPLPEQFHSVYATNGKYALIPSGIGAAIAVIVYLATLNYGFDMLQTVALGAFLVIGGVYVGNVRVRNLTAAFKAHPSVVAASEASGVDTGTVAQKLTRFALQLDTKEASVTESVKMSLNGSSTSKRKHQTFRLSPAASE